MLTNFDYNGNVITKRADGFVNLTQMCQANGKRIDNFLRLKQTQEYIDALFHSLRSEVLISVNGGNTSDIGTWGHPTLAINLARWISPKFAVWCDAHIFNLIVSGQTTIDSDPLAEMKLKLELLKAEREVAIAKTNNHVAEKNLLDTRHFITTALPEPVQQKVLGYSEVKVVEYRDRVIKDSEIIRDGTTYNKTQLCRRYGFLNKKGNPDYRKLNLAMAHLPIPEDAWERKVALQDNIEFKAEYIHELDDMLLRSERQLYLAE